MHRLFIPLIAFLLTLAPAVRAANSTAGPGALLSVSAEVTAVDLAKRELTVRGPLGNVLTIPVDRRVERLNEIKVGDVINFDYYVSVATEIRAPTEAERQESLVVTDDVVKSPPGTEPAAGVQRTLKAVTTVEGLDRATRTLTIKGPRGNSITVTVEDPSKLETLRLGDTVVVYFTEALAVSVEKRLPEKMK